MTTLMEILLTLYWISEGNFSMKRDIYKNRKSVIIITSFYLLYIIGLLYSSDFEYAFHSLKIKLPFLILPLIIGTSKKFTDKEFLIILLVFVSGTFLSSLVSSAVFFNLIPYEYTDFRQISVFISHIRFSLMIVFSVFILLFFIFSEKNREFTSVSWKIIFTLTCLWLIIFLFILKSLTGLVIFGICFFIAAWISSGRLSNIAPRFIIKVLLITSLLLVISFITRSTGRFYHREKIDFSSLDSCTFNGNRYFHDTLSADAENGHLVWIHISENELRDSWNEISSISYDGKDKRGQDIKYTLIRYLTSKGLRKDAAGVKQLAEQDITGIENGLTNYIFLNRYSLYPRIYEIIWEIDHYVRNKKPGDHSVSQRIMYYKAAISVFKNNMVFGTGTGDVTKELINYYDKHEPDLPESLRKPAHNQFLTIMVTFGICGLIIFFVTILLPVFIEKKWGNYFVRIFFLIMFLSMFADDTLETQTGISLFIFFYSLLILGIENKTSKNLK